MDDAESEMSRIAIWVENWAKNFTIASPIPDAPPVTITVLFASVEFAMLDGVKVFLRFRRYKDEIEQAPCYNKPRRG